MSRSCSSFSGYQNRIYDHMRSLKTNNNMCGPTTVDFNRPAVDQLWNNVSAVIAYGKNLMVPFLKLFGVEEGNACHLLLPISHHQLTFLILSNNSLNHQNVI